MYWNNVPGQNLACLQRQLNKKDLTDNLNTINRSNTGIKYVHRKHRMSLTVVCRKIGGTERQEETFVILTFFSLYYNNKKSVNI